MDSFHHLSQSRTEAATDQTLPIFATHALARLLAHAHAPPPRHTAHISAPHRLLPVDDGRLIDGAGASDGACAPGTGDGPLEDGPLVGTLGGSALKPVAFWSADLSASISRSCTPCSDRRRSRSVSSSA